MTIEEIKKMIKLLEAQADGKQLQIVKYDGKNYHPIEIAPKLGFYYKDGILRYGDVTEFRIKPETKYVPYTLEDLVRFMVKGTLFRHVGNGSDYKIIAVRKNGTIDMERTEKYGAQFITVFIESFFKELTLDGHPAGNAVEEEVK